MHDAAAVAGPEQCPELGLERRGGLERTRAIQVVAEEAVARAGDAPAHRVERLVLAPESVRPTGIDQMHVRRLDAFQDVSGIDHQSFRSRHEDTRLPRRLNVCHWATRRLPGLEAAIEQGLKDAEQARRDRASAEAERVATLAEARREANDILARAQKVAQESRDTDIAATREELVRCAGRDDPALRAAVGVAAIEGGASGFVSKTRGLDEVTHAVRAAAAGESVISGEMLARLLPRLHRREAVSRDSLTDREREVLQLLAEGLSNAAIAERLFVSVHTVRNHVANLSAKLGAHSKLEALSIAVREGLLPRS